MEFVKDSVFREASAVAESEGVHIYVIGGYVRDRLLKRNVKKDIDFVVDGNGIDFARKLAAHLKVKKVSVFKTYGTAMFNYKGTELEFVGARKESYNFDSRNPIVEQGTIEDDQKRRDFTINALAISLNKDSFGQLIDPFNGLEDLYFRTIKTPLEPSITFSDDPLRMLRAIRFASQLDFQILPECLEAIKNNRERIKIITQERIHAELNKILESPKPSIGLKLLYETGLLEIIFPELHQLSGVTVHDGLGHKDILLHTIQVVDNLAEKSDDLWLRWAALMHDIGKLKTKRFVEGTGWTFHSHNIIGAKMVPNIFARMHLPLNEKMKFVQKMVDLHMRPIALVEDVVTDSAIRRLIVDAGEDINSLMLLCESDITSRNEKKVAQFLENFRLVRQKIVEVEERDSLRNFQPPISGEEIMEFFNIPPSQVVGTIKNAVKDAILDGVIQNDYQQARDFMIAKGRELGLPVKE
ncbi:MAG: HD domain-containing protein [Bacteroidales bacterium]|nr:HD domain-containing protein [Bacteroidales bacterium]